MIAGPKSDFPMISVCIPVRDGERHIGESIASVLSQGYPRLEIIVQDNASRDGTYDILRGLAEKHPQLSIGRNEINIGMARNWNLVIDRASGDYVTLLSADDLLEPEFFRKCLSAFNKYQADAVTTNHYWLINGRKKARKILVGEGSYAHFSGMVLLQNPFSINFTLFARETLERMRRGKDLFSNLMVCDYDLWIRIAQSGMRIHYLKEPLGSYRVHDRNLSRRKGRQMHRQTVLVVLSHREGLRRVCRIAYRFTLLRFLWRTVASSLRSRSFDQRAFRVLCREVTR